MYNLSCFRHKGGQFLKAIALPRKYVSEVVCLRKPFSFYHYDFRYQRWWASSSFERLFLYTRMANILLNVNNRIYKQNTRTHTKWSWKLSISVLTDYYKTVLILTLPFRRGIKIGFQRLRVFVRNCFTIVTQRKTLFDVISLLGDMVIAYRTNFVVILCQEHLGHFMINVPHTLEF